MVRSCRIGRRHFPDIKIQREVQERQSHSSYLRRKGSTSTLPVVRYKVDARQPTHSLVLQKYSQTEFLKT